MHSYFDGKYQKEIYTVPTNECKFWRESMAEPTKDFYKMVRNSIEKNGIINPLMGMKEGEFVRVRIGNTRLKAAKELKILEVPMILLDNDAEWKKYFDEYSVVSVG